MLRNLLKQASELHSKNHAYAIATVIRTEPPTSGKPGDCAIVTASGELSGWIGGGCAQPVVIQEALKSLQDGKPRLIRVSPTAGAQPAEGISGFTMTCHSGGTLDIFVEPVLPKTHLIIFGRSPVAITMASLAKVLSYRVSVVAPGQNRDQFSTADVVMERFQEDLAAITPGTAVIVATQGEDDEGALEQAMQIKASYIAFVASKKKWEAVSSYLRERGFSPDHLQKVMVPAGLDIGAASPEEIAISILAQIIQLKNNSKTLNYPVIPVIQTEQTKDPVCGMTVNVATAKYASEYSGSKFYFCCAQCRSSFDKDPSQFLTAT